MVEYTPYAYAMLNTAAGTATVWLLAAVAAAVIPFRLKDTYEKYAGRFNIGKIPIMTIVANAMLAGAYLSGFIAYFVSRAIRRSQGINLDLVFKEIPPV